MAADLISPLERARDRLCAALLAGEPTAPHRAAIFSLEGAARAAQERQAAAAAQATAECADAIEQRATEIAGEMQGRVDTLLEQYLVPDEILTLSGVLDERSH